MMEQKIRALKERMRPRDLYDGVHLRRHCVDICNRDLVLRMLGEKCEFKGISVPNANSLANSPVRAELETERENMLAHQLPEVPNLSSFFRELLELFE
jgi:predicted nucleotidyltransferase component of viral defense system